MNLNPALFKNPRTNAHLLRWGTDFEVLPIGGWEPNPPPPGPWVDIVIGGCFGDIDIDKDRDIDMDIVRWR